jgi:hypothetical protein
MLSVDSNGASEESLRDGIASEVQDVNCPVCGSELTTFGETLRSFGEPSDNAVEFGEVLSLECGHRLHRSCISQWINAANEPTCPMCRTLTKWVPSVTDTTSIRQLVQQGWKTLTPNQQSILQWVWIGCAVACFTDPFGYFFMSSLLMLCTPPIFYTEMAIALATLKRFIVSKNAAPGTRILISVGIATLITLLVTLTTELE